MPRAALVAAAKLSALACLGSVARAQDAATCEHVLCNTPEHNVPPDNHLAEIAVLNATRTEDECRTGGHTATGAPDDDVLWEDCACGCRAPNRVGIIGAILGFWIFYAVVTMLFVGGISVLRAPHKKAYAELKAAGKVTEDTEEMGGDSSMGWMSKAEEEVRQDVSRCRFHPHPCDQSDPCIWRAWQCGLDAAAYLLHLRQCAMFWLANFCTMGLILLVTYFVGGSYETEWTMFAFSYGNLKKGSGARWVPVLAQFWFVGATIAFTLWKQKAFDALKLEAEEEGGRHTSLNTVWISKMPTSVTESDLKTWLDANYPDNQEANMVWDVNALGHNIRQRRRLIMKINALTTKVAENPDDAGSSKTKLKIEGLTQQVKDLEQWEDPLRKRAPRTAGSAFVTFSSEESALAFKKEVGETQGAGAGDLAVGKWAVVMAPRSAEIYWENFGLEPSEQTQNTLKSLGWTVAMFLLFTFFALSAFWIIGPQYMSILYGAYYTAEWADPHAAHVDAVGGFVFYGVFGLFFVIGFLALEEEMAPIVKYICKFEMPYTKSHKQSSYLGKIYWFYMIYHVALSTVLLGVLAMWCEISNVPLRDGNGDVYGDGCTGYETGRDTELPDTCRSGRLQLYIESVGVFHQHRLYLTACVIDFLHVLEGLKFFTRKAHTLTPEEEAQFDGAEDEEDDEELHDDEADQYFNDKFDYTRNYGESIAVLTSIATYATMHPSMMFLGSTYYGFKYYVVRVTTPRFVARRGCR